jgi:hypothetical protein
MKIVGHSSHQGERFGSMATVNLGLVLAIRFIENEVKRFHPPVPDDDMRQIIWGKSRLVMWWRTEIVGAASGSQLRGTWS